VSGERRDLLEASIKERLLDAQRHLRTLEYTAAAFGADFELTPFEEAWRSSEPEQLAHAYAVQAGYENVINACVRIAQELCRLEGWNAAGPEPSSIQALRLLHEHGVITARTRGALKDAQERRSEVQHDYVSVAARELHAAARQVIEHAPLLLQEVAGQLRQRY
jgi:uncharacterized protein YutE (UPF0331/DUF86 family)